MELPVRLEFPILSVNRGFETNRPNNASVHAWDTDKVEMDEIMYIIDGVGTFMTGGSPPGLQQPNCGDQGRRSAAEGVAAPDDGIILGADVGPRQVRRYEMRP